MKPKHKTKTVDLSRFDRLAGVRRNRRFRNVSAAVSGLSFILTIVLLLDPVFSGTPFHFGPIIGAGALFVGALSVATYFHMRFLTRE